MHPTGSLSPIVAGVAATAAARAARRDSAEAVGSFLATAARVIAERRQNAPAGNFADIERTPIEGIYVGPRLACQYTDYIG
jgi:hypothetical protein